MSSDLTHSNRQEEPSQKKSAGEILETEIREGVSALERSAGTLLVSGLSAGLDLGFSVLLMAIMWTRAQHLAEPVLEMLMANMYALGFIFVVVGRSELFTEQTTLAVLPVLDGQASIGALGRAWAIILSANLVGVSIFAGIAVMVAPHLGVASPAAFGHIASRVVSHTGSVIFFSAMLAGWLMGLLSWLVAAVRDTISQIAIVWIITSTIGFAGLHHVVLGSCEVLAGVFLNQGVTVGDFFHFLLWATLGNICGGVFFVAVIKYGHAKFGGSEAPPEMRPRYQYLRRNGRSR
jgi:formate/nitrite transporter FocA (FNT family)